jgi:hypothetical protein
MQTVSGGKIPTCTDEEADVRDLINQTAQEACTATVSRATKLSTAEAAPLRGTNAVRRELRHDLSEQTAWAAAS